MTLHIYQAQLLHFISISTASPATDEIKSSSYVIQDAAIRPVIAGIEVMPEYIAEGALVVDDVSGKIVEYGAATDILPKYTQLNKNKTGQTAQPQAIQTHDCREQLIMAGFIDTHVHYPQIDMIASYGEQLLDWLNNYTFVTEANFADPQVAEDTAAFFLSQLLAHGTTTAMVFATSNPLSADAFFSHSHAINTRMIAGNVLMDCNAPEHLCVPAEQGIKDTQDLIGRWHGYGRQHVAITPRFAITSTPKQLQLAGELYGSYADVYMQTHLAENRDEVALVQKLYPSHQGYLDVYADMGLLGRYSTLAHGIYLQPEEYQRLQQTGTQIAHCPTSNLFLGSGLFDLPKTLAYTGVSIASDVGAGTSLSMLTTLSEAYKVQQLGGNQFSAYQGLYHITLGNAQSLQLSDKIGNFVVGKEADFVVLDLAATPLLQRRLAHCQTLAERLFVLMMLGDDRVIAKTIIAGVCRYDKLATMA